jgi:hypothetical protein
MTPLAAAFLQAQPSAPRNELRAIISQSDLVYDKPAPRSEAGIPIGTGRMGTLVWTTPSQLRMQINRVDVYASNCASNSFIERNTDYCGGCAYVDFECGEDAFPESGFRQHLSVYDGRLEVREAKAVALPTDDVIAVEVPVSHVRLRMLRPAVVRTRSHVATSRLHSLGQRAALTQEFREGDYCCKSAVAIAISGSRAEITNESEVRLAAGTGRITVFIASAATFDSNEDVLAVAMRRLDAAIAKKFSGIVRETSEWWKEFWSRGYVRLSSPDGSAELVQQFYHYFLYIMACSSRGKFPPKFNGMIWSTGGDLRAWGAQHWYANLSCYYEAIPSTGRYELMDPVFDMYSGAQANCEVAAQQEWGSRGAYIPETMYFDGLERMPDDIAAEMRELYLLRKPWDQRSAKFIEYSQHRHPHSSRWNWIQKADWVDGRLVDTERGSGPYGPVSHILGTSAKVPYLYWRRYEYTLDVEWLRNRAYPMLKGAAEFYRNFPGLTKEADGKYHIHNVNSNEGIWGARDTDEDLCAMRGLLPAAIRASEILQVDDGLRASWRELLTNLTPLATSDDADAIKSAGYSGPRVWTRGRKPVVGGTGQGMLADGNSLPAWLFDLCSPDNEIANNTLTAMLRGEPGPTTSVGLLSKVPMAAATQGRSEAVRFLIPNQLRALPGRRDTPDRPNRVLANRMSLREGIQATDAEAPGRAAEALHLALLQSAPAIPASESTIRLFPAWPKDWDAEFQLLARGNFVVRGSMRGGRVDSVEIESRSGAECRLQNPWGDGAVTLRRGANTEVLQGATLRFATSKGERIRVTKDQVETNL